MSRDEPSASYSEESAKNSLLEISNDDSYFPEDVLLRTNSNSPQRRHRLYNKNKVIAPPLKQVKPKNPYISGQQVCVLRKQHILNVNNFLILDESATNREEENKFAETMSKLFNRTRTPRNIISLLRKKNFRALQKSLEMGRESPEKTGSPERMLRFTPSTKGERPVLQPMSKAISYELKKINTTCCTFRKETKIERYFASKLEGNL